eukprot:scaffold96486_cov31-Tisochrysis_lutea.AAC.1
MSNNIATHHNVTRMSIHRRKCQVRKAKCVNEDRSCYPISNVPSSMLNSVMSPCARSPSQSPTLGSAGDMSNEPTILNSAKIPLALTMDGAPDMPSSSFTCEARGPDAMRRRQPKCSQPQYSTGLRGPAMEPFSVIDRRTQRAIWEMASRTYAPLWYDSSEKCPSWPCSWRGLGTSGGGGTARNA